jgi:hypothetical protein
MRHFTEHLVKEGRAGVACRPRLLGASRLPFTARELHAEHYSGSMTSAGTPFGRLRTDARDAACEVRLRAQELRRLGL